jgi:hypothetical protein
MTSHPTSRTIDDFGDRWTRYMGNEGYYGSPELLADIFRPLLELGELEGKRNAILSSRSAYLTRPMRRTIGRQTPNRPFLEPSLVATIRSCLFLRL